MEEPYQLSYADLVKLSSANASSAAEFRRLEAVSGDILENLGPRGIGLIAITGVPGASALRTALLPLARELALLPNDDRKRILKGNGIGSDVPLKNLDRTVSSFAMQLKYRDCLDLGVYDGENKKNGYTHGAFGSGFDNDKKFKDLGSGFRELGSLMMQLGLRLARICDKAIGGGELEKSLLESCSAKGRLIHYHSTLDTLLIKGAGSKKGSRKGMFGKIWPQNQESKLWQQWHYDYGTFTVLTSPMFISTSYDRREDEGIYKLKSSECYSPGGHSCLQIFDPNMNKTRLITAPAESFIVQVGESASVLSKGKLRAALHSVSRSIGMENVSREMFVVFLQPAWNRAFDLSDYPAEVQHPATRGDHDLEDDDETEKENEEVYSVVPELRSRLKSGMTFAEFARETTKRYYSGGGLQPSR